jgi:subtilisin family serine protease
MIESPTSLVPELRSATGRGVRVIALDSGVEADHPDLAGAPVRCWRVEADASGNCRVVEDVEGDVFGHGTAAASIIRRYAGEAVIDSLRVIGRPGGWSHFVLAGLHWAIDQGYDVINCSFTTADTEFLPDYKTAPGSFPTVISSDYGLFDHLTFRRRPGELVEFVAPGQDLRVAWKGGSWRVMTGSSFAAPHLSAIAARIRQCRPGWNACQVKSALYHLAEMQAKLDAKDAAEDYGAPQDTPDASAAYPTAITR